MKTHAAVLGGLASLALATMTVAASAAPPNLFTCKETSFIANRCVLQEKQIATPFMDGDRAEETEYVVEYSFPCTGHAVNIGVKAGERGAMVAFQPGARGTLTVIGTGPLRTEDPDPAQTKRLSFRPGCKLTVTAKATASDAAVERWTREAETQIRVLNLATQVYLLARDYANITSFSRQKLETLGEAVRNIPLENLDMSTRLRLRTLADTIDNALGAGGTLESPLSPEAVQGAEAAVAHFRGVLLEEAARGQAINDRFVRAQRAVDELLASAVRSAQSEAEGTP